MTVYTLEPGRVIAKDGVSILQLARYGAGRFDMAFPITDEEADTLAGRIVSCLNNTTGKKASQS